MDSDRAAQLEQLVDQLRSGTLADTLNWQSLENRNTYRLDRPSGTVVLRGPMSGMAAMPTYQLLFLDRHGTELYRYDESSLGRVTGEQRLLPFGVVRELFHLVAEHANRPLPALDQFMSELNVPDDD